MNSSKPVLLPDPWIPAWPHTEIVTLHGAQADLVAGTLVAAANDAHYVPVIFPKSCTLYAMYFAAANGTGNYDLGLYDSSFAKIASTGTTAMSAAGLKTLSLSDYRVSGGRIYYCALSLSSTSGQVYRPNYGSNARDALIAGGWGMEASAVPLPSTMTPTTATAYTVIPAFAFGIR